MQHSVPQALERLPDIALGTKGGGRIAVDARDPEGRQTLTPVFEVGIKLPQHGAHLGHNLVVRFVHDQKPLSYRLFNYLVAKYNNRFRI